MNWNDPSTNIIQLPMQSGIKEPNSKYYLDNYFNIAWSNLPHFIYIIWLQPNPESLVIESFLYPIPQYSKLTQPKSRSEYTDFTMLFAH